MLQLTQKEQLYLQDAKKHEELCVAKYRNYAQDTSDPQLQQLFQWAEQREQSHLDSINQLLQGQMPSMMQSQGQQNQGQQQQQQNSLASIQSQLGLQQGQSTAEGSLTNQGGMLDNQTVCDDMLTIEKQASLMYENALLESSSQQLRQALDHIQKEEEEHAFAIFEYMQQQGWYQ